MRPALLAISATALLAVGIAFSLQAIRPPAPSIPAVREAVASAPAPAANTEAEERSVKAAPAPVSEPTAPAVVKVKTVRIQPEQPVPATEIEQQATSVAEVRRPEAAVANDQPAVPPAKEGAAALKSPTRETESVEASPAPRVRTARAKPPVVSAKRTRAKRKLDQLAGDHVAKEPLSYAPKEAGPESLNPLGKLLSGTR